MYLLVITHTFTQMLNKTIYLLHISVFHIPITIPEKKVSTSYNRSSLLEPSLFSWYILFRQRNK